MAGNTIGRIMPARHSLSPAHHCLPGAAGGAVRDKCQAVRVTLQDIHTGHNIPAMPAIQANALHEIRSTATLHAASATGFALALGSVLARALASHGQANSRHAKRQDGLQARNADNGPLFWITDPASRLETGGFYTPGMGGFAISPQDLVRITPASRRDCLWAAGEIAATPGIGGFCLAEFHGNPGEIDLTASRRLMLRAAQAHVPVIVLRHGAVAQTSACATRWLVKPVPLPEISRTMPAATPRHPRDGPSESAFLAAIPRFHVTLEKCRNAGPGPESGWILEWNSHDQGFRNARLAETADTLHPAAAGQARM